MVHYTNLELDPHPKEAHPNVKRRPEGAAPMTLS